MIAVVILQLLGFAALASAMHATPAALRLDRRHARFGSVTGALMLLLSAIGALRSAPTGIAIVDWCGLASLAAAIVLLILTGLRRRVTRR